MSHFETNPKQLKHLLGQIHAGELTLPDFQRDFVWDPGAVEELIESIMRNYPAGSLLFLKHSGTGFQIREFQGAPTLKSNLGTSYLVLDGQQRLTSLYQAFFGKGEHRFFLDINELLETEDIEAAVWHETAKRSERNGLTKLDYQASKLLCPLERVMTGGFDSWVDDVIERRPEKGEALKELRASLRAVNKDWIQPILEYQFPVVTLGSETPLDAVCKMFETLNRRGVKLTVFELLMARSFANNVSLRTLWDEALAKYTILSEFEIDPYYVLQTISLLNGGSLKRKQILDMAPATVSTHWDGATGALAEVIEFLRRNAGVLSPALLPYHTMLVPMAAAWASTTAKGPKDAKRRERFLQWFWASVFSQRYEKGPTSRGEADYKDLVGWITSEGREPAGLRALYFNPEMFMEITPKQRALYRGTLALVVANGALDFHKSEKLTFDYLVRNKVDDHHVFPQAFMRGKTDIEKVNCVLNRTLIDRKTNILISDKAPSKYLGSIAKEAGESSLGKILSSHVLPAEMLKKDDFDAFLRARARMLMEQLALRVGREISSIPVSTEYDDESTEEDDSTTTRDRIDPSLINCVPARLLEGLPESSAELFSSFSKEVRRLFPDVWWKENARRVHFWSPERSFATCRISRTGLHLTVYTAGRELAGVDPIVQKDGAGEFWGRIKLRKVSDLDGVMAALNESLARIHQSIHEGTPTSWFASKRTSVA